jgi:cellulose synthase/poly-beta-1,6-N-acetylglucosamine synthase-like glycosyltransferase
VFFDPWHIVTLVSHLYICLRVSSKCLIQAVQYLLLFPTYTNVINVYAFCNTHDVSWGTKGDDKPKKLKTVFTTVALTLVEVNRLLALFVLSLIFDKTARQKWMRGQALGLNK